MEKVFIKNRNGLKLALRVTLPKNASKLVFLEHGLGARKEYPHMLVMEEVFAENGYNVVNMDAANSLNESESSPEGITFSGHYQDLEDVIAWAKTQSFYTEPFALAGQSLGAAAIILFAGTYPEKVNLLVSASFPWVKGKEKANDDEMLRAIAKNGFYDKVSKTTGRTLRMYKSFLDDVAKTDFTDAAKNITADTFLIVGTLDSENHIENNKKLYKLLQCKKTLMLLPDVPHDLANTPETKETFTKAMQQVFLNKEQTK